MIELTLLSYKGPGSIAGIPLEVVQVSEHASGEGETVLHRWWEVAAEADRRDVSEETVRRAAAEGKCLVVIPECGEALAYMANVSLVDGQRWVFEARGEGRAPLMEPDRRRAGRRGGR
jgi:hypothetical protein